MKRLLLFSLAVLMAALAARADVTINATNFPDAAFRSYLMSEYPSGTITTAQLNARTELNLSGKGISNAKGIEYFTQLTRLDLYNNNLTTINVSSNTKLTYLNVGINKLTSITLGTIPTLEQLYLQNNQLTSLWACNYTNLRTLWVSNNPNLATLSCYRNVLTNLDISNCTSLNKLECFENANLSNIYGLGTCTAITYLDCEDCAITSLSAVLSMPSLKKLYARNNRLTSLDAYGLHQLEYIRVSGNTQLTDLSLRCYYNYNLTSITGLADCTALTYLDCEDCAITSLAGVNNMTNLQALWARNNQLTGTLAVFGKPQLSNLRVSGNTGLTHLYCSNDALVSLDVTGCTGLKQLDCHGNASLTSVIGLANCTALTLFACNDCAMTSLDMTFCRGLNDLYCYNNQLTSLDLTGLTSLVNLNCRNNPGLGEIIGLIGCYDMAFLDCTNCSLTSLRVDYMDDLQELWCGNNRFEVLTAAQKSKLTKLYVNNSPHLYNLHCYIDALVTLDVSDCPKLNFINCEHNQLTELDLSTCPSLIKLVVVENQLTELDISNNPKLAFLWCADNQLTSLDLSNCADNFYSLYCSNNQISGTLDLSRFADLEQFEIANNKFSELILGNHPKLQGLGCSFNQISGTIDLSNCGNLEQLFIACNHISGLRVANCPSLHEVSLEVNNVKASEMGQFVADLPTWPENNMGTLHALITDDYMGYTEGNVMTVEQVNLAHSKGWNVSYYNQDTNNWEPYSGSSFQRGDVNGDGNVNISDVTALINYLLSHNATGLNLDAANCNQDSTINISDVTALINFLLSHSW